MKSILLLLLLIPVFSDSQTLTLSASEFKTSSKEGQTDTSTVTLLVSTSPTNELTIISGYEVTVKKREWDMPPFYYIDEHVCYLNFRKEKLSDKITVWIAKKPNP